MRELFRRNKNLWLYGPIFEEIIHRGFVLPVINKTLSTLGMEENYAKVGAVILDGIIFGALHPKGARLSTGLASMLFGGLSIFHQGSLAPSMSSHMALNATSIAADYYQSRKRFR